MTASIGATIEIIARRNPATSSNVEKMKLANPPDVAVDSSALHDGGRSAAGDDGERPVQERVELCNRCREQDDSGNHTERACNRVEKIVEPRHVVRDDFGC